MPCARDGTALTGERIAATVWMPAGPFRTVLPVRHGRVCLSPHYSLTGLGVEGPWGRAAAEGMVRVDTPGFLRRMRAGTTVSLCVSARAVSASFPTVPSTPQAFLRRASSSTSKRACPRARPSPPPRPLAAGGTTTSTTGLCRRKRCGGQLHRPRLRNHGAFRRHGAERQQLGDALTPPFAGL